MVCSDGSISDYGHEEQGWFPAANLSSVDQGQGQGDGHTQSGCKALIMVGGAAEKLSLSGSLVASQHRVLASRRLRLTANFSVIPTTAMKSPELPLPPSNPTLNSSPIPVPVLDDAVVSTIQSAISADVTVTSVCAHWQLLHAVVIGSGPEMSPLPDMSDRKFWYSQILQYARYMEQRACHEATISVVSTSVMNDSDCNNIDSGTYTPYPDPPRAVYYVWLVHMLQPLAYRDDCLAKYGRVVSHHNHVPTFAIAVDDNDAADRKGSKDEDTQPGVTNLETLALSIFAHVDWWMGLDGVRAIHDDILSDQPTMARDDEKAEKLIGRVIKSYSQFLQLNAVSKNMSLAPGFAMDLVWHSHQCAPVEYGALMNCLSCSFINHIPCGELNPPDPQWTQNTHDQWRTVFGEEVDDKVLPLDALGHCCCCVGAASVEDRILSYITDGKVSQALSALKTEGICLDFATLLHKLMAGAVQGCEQHPTMIQVLSVLVDLCIAANSALSLSLNAKSNLLLEKFPLLTLMKYGYLHIAATEIGVVAYQNTPELKDSVCALLQPEPILHLYVAVLWGLTDAITTLLSSGVDPLQIEEKSGLSAFHLIVLRGLPEMAKLVLSLVSSTKRYAIVCMLPVWVRLRVLVGDFDNLEFIVRAGLAADEKSSSTVGVQLQQVRQPSYWKTSSWLLKVFVSSTFTDTHRERNVLMEQLLPTLKEYAASRDISIVLVDMRYGIKDENTLEHLTWQGCFEGIKNCYEESDGLFFLSLQGNKYGYVPLPKYISQTILDEKLSVFSEEVGAVARANYILDTNSLPPRYVLKDLISLDDNSYWSETLPTLLGQSIAGTGTTGSGSDVVGAGAGVSLSGIPLDPTAWCCEELVVGRSVTEWETKCALADDASLARIAWFHRTFDGGVRHPSRTRGGFCLTPRVRLRV